LSTLRGLFFLQPICDAGFDPKKDVIGIIMTQTLPFVEPRFMGLYEAFERGVYRTLAG
jgi:hypothetical protein